MIESSDTARTAFTALGGVATLIVVALVAIVVVPQAIGAQASYVVLSGSMSPAIDPGAVVVVQDTSAEQIEEGDVITFTDTGVAAAATSTDRVTHRVIEINRTNGGLWFQTKGDANEEPDPTPVVPEQVIGKVWFHVPLLGRFVLFAGTRAGIISFVVVPGILLAGSELYSLYTEAVDTGGSAKFIGESEEADTDEATDSQSEGDEQ